MKRVVLLLLCFFLTSQVVSQSSYSVNGQTYELFSEVRGELNLLWNIIDDEYRYFIQKGGNIIELTNTKGADNKYQEEYKSVLSNLTQGSNLKTGAVNLTLPSLRDFVNSYNKSVDPDFKEENKKASVGAKLLAFGGITNSPFVTNPDNISNPVLGAEIEVYEANNLPRHSLFFQLKHVFSNDDFNYSNTQLSLGYRFRFIKKESFNLYANLTMATYSFIETEIMVDDQLIASSSNNLDAPFIFGVGADIKVTRNGYITIMYDELFALALDNEGNFSTHITLGYKLNL